MRDTSVIALEIDGDDLDDLLEVLPEDAKRDDAQERWDRLMKRIQAMVEDGPRVLDELEAERRALESEQAQIQPQADGGKTFDERNAARERAKEIGASFRVGRGAARGAIRPVDEGGNPAPEVRQQCCRYGQSHRQDAIPGASGVQHADAASLRQRRSYSTGTTPAQTRWLHGNAGQDRGLDSGRWSGRHLQHLSRTAARLQGVVPAAGHADRRGWLGLRMLDALLRR